jgi:hypothetical protein
MSEKPRLVIVGRDELDDPELGEKMMAAFGLSEPDDVEGDEPSDGR